MASGRAGGGPPSVIQGRFVPGGVVQAKLQPGRGVLQLAPGQLPAGVGGGRAPGQALPPPVLQQMESLFGASFADVRVHVGPEAPSLGAVAFTHGSSLFFAPGQYAPTTPRGRQLLGHELAHVVQQRQGRVRNPFGAGVAVVQDPGLEAEAERMGLRAATPVQAKMPAPPRLPAPAAAAPPKATPAKTVPIKTVQARLEVGQNLPLTNSRWHNYWYSDQNVQDLSYVKNGSRYFSNTPQVREFLRGKIATRVRASVQEATNQEILRVLAKYLASKGGERWLLTSGRLSKDFTVNSWDLLADRMIYELRSETYYDSELMMAMCVEKSHRIKASVDIATNRLHVAIRLLLKRQDLSSKARQVFEDDLGNTAYDPVTKHYHAFQPGSPSINALLLKGNKGRSLEESVAALHDLLEVAFQLFKQLSTVTSHPLIRQVKVTTAPNTRRVRDQNTTDEAINFTLGRGLPTEMGPSYTTVRFCSINEVFKHVSKTNRPRDLTKQELTDLVWAIFAYWTLSYRKSYSGAHCFFEVYDAARNFGIQLTANGQHLNVFQAQGKFSVSLSKQDLKVLRSRQQRLREGLDQAPLTSKGLLRVLPNPL